MLNKTYLIMILLYLTASQIGCTEKSPYPIQGNSEGFVPDSLTAKKIAEAIWLPIYGEDVLDQKPYTSKLVGDSVWVIEGILDQNKVGGTAYIEIRKSDCKILKVTHGK